LNSRRRINSAVRQHLNVVKNLLAIIGAAFVILSVGALIHWFRHGEEKARETFGQISIIIWSTLAVVGMFLLVARIWSFTFVSAISAVERLGVSPGLAGIIVIISLPIIGSLVSFVVGEFRDRTKRQRSR